MRRISSGDNAENNDKKCVSAPLVSVRSAPWCYPPRTRMWLSAELGQAAQLHRGNHGGQLGVEQFRPGDAYGEHRIQAGDGAAGNLFDLIPGQGLDTAAINVLLFGTSIFDRHE